MSQLTEKSVSEALGRSGEKIGKLRECYRKGMLTDGDGTRHVMNVLFGTFSDLLHKCSLMLRITADNYDAFSDEYNGADTKGCASPWLVRFDAEKTPATAEEKRLVLRLMKGLHIRPDHFEPKPDGVVYPGKKYCHTWNCCSSCGIAFDCVDDGGLTEDPDPVGKTFLLKSGLGLASHLFVKEDRRGTPRRGWDFDESTVKADFLAEGTIEGYTAQSKRCHDDVLIRLDGDGRVIYLAYYEYGSDLDAFNSFPLWKEYFEWTAKRAERRRKTALSLINDGET